MLNRKLIAIPASLLVLGLGAVGASADTFLTGDSLSTNNQGINNAQGAEQGATGGSGTTIINKSNYSPTENQTAVNANVNAQGSGATTGDLFNTGGTVTNNQGINNAQGAEQGDVGGSGTTIVNASKYAPGTNQGVINVNINAAGGGTTTGDLFLLGASFTGNDQGINSAQGADQGALGGSGTSIVNTTGFTPQTNQGTTNGNCNDTADLSTCEAVAEFLIPVVIKP